MKELLVSLLPVAVELAHEFASAGDDEARDEARRKAERATSDRLMLWLMANGTTLPASVDDGPREP